MPGETSTWFGGEPTRPLDPGEKATAGSSALREWPVPILWPLALADIGEPSIPPTPPPTPVDVAGGHRQEFKPFPVPFSTVKPRKRRFWRLVRK